MILKLFGNSQSTCTKRVAVVLHEMKIPFEFVNIDFMKGEHKSPNYLTKQPFGQVPYLDDDGFILYESRAIARYIALKYASQGTQLIPTDPKKQALFEQAASVEMSNFEAHAFPAIFEVLVKPRIGGVTDTARVKSSIVALSTNLDVYDHILSKQGYIAGEDITLADLFHLPRGAMLPVAGHDVIQQKPNVARWFNEISSRPSWQAVKDGVSSMSSYD